MIHRENIIFENSLSLSVSRYNTYIVRIKKRYKEQRRVLVEDSIDRNI